MSVTHSQHSDEKSSQSADVQMRNVVALRTKPFCLLYLHVWKINRANKSSSKILLSKDSLPKPLRHTFIKEADAILRSVKDDIAQTVM